MLDHVRITAARLGTPGGDAEPETQPDTWLAAGPELLFGCLSLGVCALVIQLASPPMGRLGVAASTLLVSGVAMIPIVEPSIVALGVVALSAAALWCETTLLPAVGLYAAAGWLGLVVSGLALHDPRTGAHPVVVVALSTAAALGSYTAGRRAWRRVEQNPLERSILVIGRRTTILHTRPTDHHHGTAILNGRLWSVHDPANPLREGTAVTVVDATAAELIVTPDRSARES